MAFWSKWFRKPADAVEQIPTPRKQGSIFTDDDREYIRTALDRFVASGLRIWPTLDRDLIVARALLDAERWSLEENRVQASNDPIESLFLALADETDCLTYHPDDVEELFAPLTEMTDEAATELLQRHSYSVFENANTLWTINEGDRLDRLAFEFSSLTGGALKINDVEVDDGKKGIVKVSFQVEGLGERHFEVENIKRTDIIPALLEMSDIAKCKNIGRFVLAYNGTDDSVIIIFTTEVKLPDIVNFLHLTKSGIDGELENEYCHFL